MIYGATSTFEMYIAVQKSCNYYLIYSIMNCFMIKVTLKNDEILLFAKSHRRHALNLEKEVVCTYAL